MAETKRVQVHMSKKLRDRLRELAAQINIGLDRDDKTIGNVTAEMLEGILEEHPDYIKDYLDQLGVTQSGEQREEEIPKGQTRRQGRK